MKTEKFKYIIGLLAMMAILSAPVYGQPENKQTEGAKTQVTESQPQLFIQDFENGPLSVQYRYVGQDLRFIRLMNTGERPIMIDILHEHYILGKDDFLVVDPPRVEYIHIRQTPYEPSFTMVGALLKNRFSDTYLYRLPKQENETASK